VASRRCSFIKEGGEPCEATPLLDAPFCFWHDPEHAKEAEEARRLGGLRRRREKAVSGAYGFEGFESVGQIRRLIDIAAIDTLALENSVARSRTLAYLAQVGISLLEKGEMEERLRALEEMVRATPGRRRSA